MTSNFPASLEEGKLNGLKNRKPEKQPGTESSLEAKGGGVGRAEPKLGFSPQLPHSSLILPENRHLLVAKDKAGGFSSCGWQQTPLRNGRALGSKASPPNRLPFLFVPRLSKFPAVHPGLLSKDLEGAQVCSCTRWLRRPRHFVAACGLDCSNFP